MFEVVFINVCDGSRKVYASGVNVNYFTIRDWSRLLAAFANFRQNFTLCKLEITPLDKTPF